MGKIKERFYMSTTDEVMDIESTPVKYDSEKNLLQLLPFSALEEVGKCLTYGANKYEPNNWRGGFKWTRLLGSTLRHLFAWSRGIDTDEESGLSHLAHAATNILFLLEHVTEGLGTDDRYRSS